MSISNQIVIDNHTFIISDVQTEEEMDQIQNAIEQDKRVQTHDEYDQPGIEITLILKDSQGQVWGGVIASTVFKVMHLEVLWVADEYRRQGYASQLVLGAEQIGLAHGCNTSQTWTFSFQGPDFYPTIGYKLLGIYDGYPNGITEHCFMKRLVESQNKNRDLGIPDNRGLYLTTDADEEDKKIIHAGLHRHVKANVGEGYKGTKIRFTIKDQVGELIGGLSAWTTLSNLILDNVWITERFRRKGLGRILMQEMERTAKEQGCIASQAYCFSFQTPTFFQNMGYQVLGISDGYPQAVRELYLIKKYV
jgi:GNAT superfamily N-acetyltransferase